MTIQYFDRNGKRMSMMEWAKAYENANYRVLGQHNVGNLLVSTVWLGLDHRYLDDDGPPIIFESMIFSVPEGDDRWTSLEMRRYSTEHEAMIGHTDLVHMANLLHDIAEEVGDEDDGVVREVPQDQDGAG